MTLKAKGLKECWVCHDGSTFVIKDLAFKHGRKYGIAPILVKESNKKKDK